MTSKPSPSAPTIDERFPQNYSDEAMRSTINLGKRLVELGTTAPAHMWHCNVARALDAFAARAVEAEREAILDYIFSGSIEVEDVIDFIRARRAPK